MHASSVFKRHQHPEILPASPPSVSALSARRILCKYTRSIEPQRRQQTSEPRFQTRVVGRIPPADQRAHFSTAGERDAFPSLRSALRRLHSARRQASGRSPGDLVPGTLRRVGDGNAVVHPAFQSPGGTASFYDIIRKLFVPLHQPVATAALRLRGNDAVRQNVRFGIVRITQRKQDTVNAKAIS